MPKLIPQTSFPACIGFVDDGRSLQQAEPGKGQSGKSLQIGKVLKIEKITKSTERTDRTDEP